MTDQLISFPTAKLAKEKGFPQGNNNGIYHTEPKNHNTGDRGQYINHERFLIITQSLLQRWLREYKFLHISITYKEVKGKKIEGINSVYFDIEIYRLTGGDDWKTYKFEGYSDNYEKCLEKGLQEALNLIP
jgi:hypothetical protein